MADSNNAKKDYQAFLEEKHSKFAVSYELIQDIVKKTTGATETNAKAVVLDLQKNATSLGE